MIQNSKDFWVPQTAND